MLWSYGPYVLLLILDKERTFCLCGTDREREMNQTGVVIFGGDSPSPSHLPPKSLHYRTGTSKRGRLFLNGPSLGFCSIVFALSFSERGKESISSL